METPDKKPRSNKAYIWIMGLLFLSLIVGGASLSGPWWKQYIEKTPPENTFETSTREHLSTLDSRVLALETRSLPVVPPAIETAPIHSVPIEDHSAEMYALIKCIAPLKKVLRSSIPFQKDLQALKAFGEEHKDKTAFTNMIRDLVDALQEMAPSGVPTREMLIRDLPKASQAVLESSGESQDLPHKILHKIRAQYWLRSLDPLKADSVNGLLAQAESALTQGDLPKGIALMEALPTNPQLQTWLAHGKNRLKLEEMLDFSDLLPIALTSSKIQGATS